MEAAARLAKLLENDDKYDFAFMVLIDTEDGRSQGEIYSCEGAEFEAAKRAIIHLLEGFDTPKEETH